MIKVVQGKPPTWAIELANRVLRDRNIHRPVYLTWRKRKRLDSGGTTYPGVARIVISAGTSRKDQKLVLLHELAHMVAAEHHHDLVYWTCAWELYRDYGVDMAYAQKREFEYKATARKAYKLVTGKRAMKIRPTSRHRHKWTELSRQDHGNVALVEQQCNADWYGSESPCGAWRRKWIKIEVAA